MTFSLVSGAPVQVNAGEPEDGSHSRGVQPQDEAELLAEG